LPESKKQLAHRIYLCEADMKEVQGYLQGLVDLDDTGVRGAVSSALMIAAIVIYARPFTKSQSLPNAKPRLAIEDLGGLADAPDLLALHEELLSHRSKKVAHADKEFHWSEISGTSDNWTRWARRPNYLHGIDLQLFMRLTKRVALNAARLCIELDQSELPR